MGSTDNRKTKKRKSRKPTKPSPSQNCQSTTSIVEQNMENSLPIAEASLEQQIQEQEIKELEKIMDAENDADNPMQAFAKGPNPYLGGDRCLLCRCERKDPKNRDKSEPPKPHELPDCSTPGVGSAALSQLPLWVCPECRKTVEEEEKRAQSMSTMLEQDLNLEPPILDLPLLGDMSGEKENAGTQCSCQACTERRHIENEHDKDTQELQQCWMELRHVVRYVYREAGTGLSESEDWQATALPDQTKMKELVHRLVVRDPHQLFQRLESQGREYVIEMKVRLLKQLTTGHKTPPQAKQFVSMLLEEYSNLCAAAKTLASFLIELELEHLKRFNLTWELHNKHMFQSIIYTDPVVQNSLPMLITQLRLGAASKEAYHEDTYPNILHRYLKFDDEMSVIAVVWRDCQQLIEDYNDEQSALKAKQKMLREDWEFFKAQRKLLEQQVLKNKSPALSQHLETQFLRHKLQGIKPQGDETLCPNCNHKRCPCDECTISHMITCGIINPEVADQMSVHHHPTAVSFLQDPSRYIIDVSPPSMSSTSSSSGSESPIAVDPQRLTMPFEDNFELAKDEIPEELDEGSGYSDGEDDEESTTDEIHVKNENGEDGKVDEDDDDDDDDEDEGNYDDDEDYDEDDDEDGNDDDDDDDDEDFEYEEVTEDGEEILKNVNTLSSVHDGGEEDDDDDDDQLLDRVENCDCSHCTLQAKIATDQAKAAEDLQNQCQCHACLQQGGNLVAASLPQHLPTAHPPRPAALHLYPHIHGAMGQGGPPPHPIAAGGTHPGHIRPELQPQLYEMHNNPLQIQMNQNVNAQQQGKNGGSQQQKKHTLFNLDLHSQDALHEHIYHAYGDWDNNYDNNNKLLLSNDTFGGGGLGSELLSAPTPPLLDGGGGMMMTSMPPDSSFTSTLTTIAVSVQSQTSLGNVAFANANSMSSSSAPPSVLQQCLSAAKPITSTSFTSSPLGAAHASSSGLITSLAAPVPVFSTDGTATSFQHLQQQHQQQQHQHIGLSAEALKTLKPFSQHALSLSNQSPVRNKPSLVVPSSAGMGTFATSGTAAAVAVSSVPGTNVAISSSHSDMCLKHAPFLLTHHLSMNAAGGGQGVGSQHQAQHQGAALPTLPASQPLMSAAHGMKLNTELLRTAAFGTPTPPRDPGDLAQTITNQNISAFNLPHSQCNHPSISSATVTGGVPPHPAAPGNINSMMQLAAAGGAVTAQGIAGIPASALSMVPASVAEAVSAATAGNVAAASTAPANLGGHQVPLIAPGGGGAGNHGNHHHVGGNSHHGHPPGAHHHNHGNHNSAAANNNLAPPVTSSTTNALVANAHTNNLNHNVSVGTSTTACNDPECDGHHHHNNNDDDSVDDSCSEQSSSTSTSNQKDGKYCDCCYCEFFGHSTPPTLPTSRNYAEIRDRLRLRLKKKNEEKTEENIEELEPEETDTTTQEYRDQRKLDDLIRFINGDNEGHAMEKPLSAKAAKRARQKARKAEEKARQEAEELARQQAEEEARRREEERKQKELARSQQAQQQQGKKKRHRHKDRAAATASTGKGGNATAGSGNANKKSTSTSGGSFSNNAGSKQGKESSRSNVNVANVNHQGAKLQHTSSSSSSSSLSSSQPKGGVVVEKSAKAMSGTGTGKVHQHQPVKNDGTSSLNHNHVQQQQQRNMKNQPRVATMAAAKHNTSTAECKINLTSMSTSTSKTSKDVSAASRAASNATNPRGADNNNSNGNSGGGKAGKKSGKQQQPQNMKAAPCIESSQQNGTMNANERSIVKEEVCARILQEALAKQNRERQHVLHQHQQQPSSQPPQQQQNQVQSARNMQQQHTVKGLQTTPTKSVANNKQQRTPPAAPSSPASKQAHNVNASTLLGAPSNTPPPPQQQQNKKRGKQQQQQQPRQQQPNQNPVQLPQNGPVMMVNGLQDGGGTGPTLHHHPQPHAPLHQHHPALNSLPPATTKPQPLPHVKNHVVMTPNHQIRELKVGGHVIQEAPPGVLLNHVNKENEQQKKVPNAKASMQPRDVDRNRIEEQRPNKVNDPGSGQKSKKNKKKNKGSDDLTSLDEIFMPKGELEHGELDEHEREIEEFKRFCMTTPPVKPKEKLQVTMNLKDIFSSKKKPGLGCM